MVEALDVPAIHRGYMVHAAAGRPGSIHRRSCGNSKELSYPGNTQGMLRARASSVGAALEAATGRGWEVRFAPIQYTVAGTSTNAQKLRVSNVNGVEWRPYGIALALSDVNVWYTSYPLSHSLIPPAASSIKARLISLMAAITEHQANRVVSVHARG